MISSPPSPNSQTKLGAKSKAAGGVYNIAASELLYAVSIPGRPIVKKNTQRTFGRGRTTRRVSTARYRAWELNAIAACNLSNSIALLDMPLIAVYRFYFKDRQAEADVSNLCEAPGDLLQKAGVIKDDRLIKLLIAEKFFGESPRTEIELYRFKGDEYASAS